MSILTKKKHVYEETTSKDVEPVGTQSIVKIISPRGNNLHDVEDSQNQQFIVSMPVKFRKTVWIKRGDYCIVEPIEEGNKVKAEIVAILQRDNIKYLKSRGLWPEKFESVTEASEKIHDDHDDMFPSSDESEQEEDDGDYLSRDENV